MEFRFDFIVPKHCAENGTVCGPKLLSVDEEFTKV